jgi:hypothetical protein
VDNILAQTSLIFSTVSREALLRASCQPTHQRVPVAIAFLQHPRLHIAVIYPRLIRSTLSL